MVISTTVGSIQIQGIIGNSPGPRKELKEWHEVGRSPAGMITVGSFTPKPRPGNSGEVFWIDGIPNTALNSLSLPSKSPQQHSEEIEELRVYGKPINVSIAGFTRDDFVYLARLFAKRGFSIELNLTCPNVEGRVFAYDLDSVQQTIISVRQIVDSGKLIVKLNPHPDETYIEAMCLILEKEQVDAVALCNTVPNCIVLDPNTLKPVTTPNNGLAGLSGTGIKPIVMGQVFQYRQRLPSISIVAEGGIWSGQDVLDYFAVGANFCRTATFYAQRGPTVFTDLTMQFLDQMETHGFESIRDIPVRKAG